MVCGLRLFHSSSLMRCAVAKVDKTLLGKLRKTTGYPISHCKNALQIHNNDFEQANKWLAAQAQAEGWAKATKLSGRSIKQGLLGVCVSPDNSMAALMELNCETDFVARNKLFTELCCEVTQVCLSAGSLQHSTGSDAPTIHKEMWNREQVSELRHSDCKSLGDRVALTIGLCGENMAIHRAMKVSATGPGVELYGYSHPSTVGQEVAGGGLQQSPLFGKYATLVAVRRTSSQPPDMEVLKHLCLQIIGMNPESIGTAADVQQSEEPQRTDADSESPQQQQPDEEEQRAQADPPSNDRFLMQQKWLDDDDYTVAQVLQEAELEVLDFIRLQVGEGRTEE